jgi:transposase
MEIEEEATQAKSKVPIPVRWEIVRLRRDNNTFPDIAKLVQRPISTCQSIFQKWSDTGDVEDVPRSGRPPIISPSQKEKLIETVKNNEDMSIRGLIEESKVDISKTSAWNVMKGYGFKCKTQSIKWSMEPHHKEGRLKWAKEYINKSDEFWQRVIFTDESRAQFNKSKQKFWVLGDKKPSPIERDRWQASVLLWGAISLNGNCILELINGTMNAVIYLDILKKRLLKNYRNLRSDRVEGGPDNALIFQQDGASIHSEANVDAYFRSKHIILLPWPAKSPDLNLIESIWAWLKKEMKTSYQTLEELEEDVIIIWERLPFEFVENLYRGMKGRIQAVIEAEGGPTDY